VRSLYTVMIHITLYIRTSSIIIPLLTSLLLFSRNILHDHANTVRIFMCSITQYTTNPITHTQLENVAIAMHCNLRPFDAEPVIFRINRDARTKFEVGQPISCCPITFLPRCMQRGLATRKLSVRLSVRLYVKRVICDKTKQSCAHILTPHGRSFILVL